MHPVAARVERPRAHRPSGIDGAGNVAGMARTGTISVLFTDIVGSTSLMEAEGNQAWDDHRRAHFGVLREALGNHHGTEVKNTGDGLMAVFAR